MLWSYQVYDSLTQEMDTVLVSVVDTISFNPSEPRTIWKSRSNATGDVTENYVGVKGDTLSILSDTLGDVDIELFVYPFELGAEWEGGSGFHDTARVTQVGAVSTPAGVFTNATRIERTWNQDFEGGGDFSVTWIVPNVGIVFRHFHSQYSDGSTIHVTLNEVWELIDYDLMTFELTDYPVSVGRWWQYEIETDNGDTVIFDSLTVTSTDKLTLQTGETAYVWNYVWSTRFCGDLPRGEAGVFCAHQEFVIVTDGRLEFRLDTLEVNFDQYSYQFPLALGKDWGLIFIRPPEGAVDKGAISVPAGDFPTGFEYYTYGGGLDYYWNARDWLVPSVGMVHRERHRFGYWPDLNETWRLLEYGNSIPLF
jgi:hypothetical protein